MVVILSYIIAVIISVVLAVVLYPIAGIFWILGLLGKIGDVMFDFITKTIKGIWRDISVSKNNSQQGNSTTEE